MNDEHRAETVAETSPGRKRFDVNWTRGEGILGLGALLTSFVWFLGMPTGMAVGVGFGIVLLSDFIRALLFESSRSDGSQLSTSDSI